MRVVKAQCDVETDSREYNQYKSVNNKLNEYRI